MDCVKFESNNTISFYKTNNSEPRQSVRILLSIFDDVIVNKVT